MALPRKARADRAAPLDRPVRRTRRLPPWPGTVAVMLVVSCLTAVGIAVVSEGGPARLPRAFEPSAALSAGPLAAGEQPLPTGSAAAASAVQTSALPWEDASATAAPSGPDLTQLPASGTASPASPQSPAASRQAVTAPPAAGTPSAPVPTATSGTIPSTAPTVRATPSTPVSTAPPAAPTSAPAPTPAPTRTTRSPAPTPAPSVTFTPAGTTVPPPPSGWTTLFSDTFDGAAGSAPSTANWRYDIGTGFGNNEVQRTTDSTSNTYLDGTGDLVLQANESNGSWTSAQLETTRDDFAAPPGGKLEMTASIQQPDVANPLGYWPAFWALGAPMRAGGRWPQSGEIDMIEDINGRDMAAQTFHFGNSSHLGTGLRPCPDTTSTCQAGFHTYTVIIDRTNTSAETLQFLMDGAVEATYTEAQVGTAVWQSAVDHGFYILLDLAMGGTAPDRQCHCTAPTQATTSGGTMRVGYVAVYQQPAP